MAAKISTGKAMRLGKQGSQSTKLYKNPILILCRLDTVGVPKPAQC